MSLARKRRKERRRGTRAIGLSGILAEHPRLVLASWLAVVGVLAVVGRNLAGDLDSHPLYISGTEPAQARELSLRQFGSDESMVVALRGPAAAVSREGRELARRVDALPHTVVVSPWSTRGTLGGLRPQPGVAGLVVRVGHQSTARLAEMLDLVEAVVGRTVTPPVHASIGGLPRLFDSYVDANKHASETGEMIAIPALLLVLLLVFRSVVAALIPVVVGGIVVAATQGVMRLLLGVVEIDAFALGAAGMMGLALGVDYSLLVVSRYREERARSDPAGAVGTTVGAAARSIIPAGAGLCLAMLIAAQILPGNVVASSALTIVVATVLSTASALVAVPAAIMVLGDNLERWTLPARLSAGGAPLLFSSRLRRRPRVVALVVGGLVVLAALASTLDSGVATPDLLPAGDKGRIEEERVEDALGPGWLAPIEILITGDGEPMTSPRRMRSLVAFQEKVERDKGVETVAGFSPLQHRLKPLSRFEETLVSQQHGLNRLGTGLARTLSGARRNRSGLNAAVAGAGRLSEGTAAATDGTGLLVEGLRRAHTGSSRLTEALVRTDDGTGRLLESSSSASDGAKKLAAALEKGQKKVGETRGNVESMKNAMRAGTGELVAARTPLEIAEARLTASWQALQQMSVGRTDPEYAAVQQAMREVRELLSGTNIENGEATGAPGVGESLTRAQRQFDLGLELAGQIGSNNDKAGRGTRKLAREARRLDQGIKSLADGTSRIASAVAALSAEGRELSPALQRLRAGTTALAGGLGRLTGGAGQLAGGLGGGTLGAERLAAALRRLDGGLSQRPRGLRQLRRRAPHLFDSGYFYLAGLDGSTSSRRDLANFTIDVDHGGHTARIMVIPRHPVTTVQGRETLDRLRSDAHDYAERTSAHAVVGGLAASQLTIDETLTSRTELARLAMMIVTLMILIVVLRSVTVPAIAAFLNLLTVTATMGMLALLFNGSLLGGPGYVDAADIPASIMVIFGLAIDYEVFIFARMREEYVRTGSPEQAVDNGLARTAPVVTGAAVIMIVVFLCFSTSGFITLRNFGVAQATAVFIDAFIIRLIVLPVIMKGLGQWSWWMPRWLDRLLPGGR